MFRTFAAVVAALMLPTITACGGASSTASRESSPASAPTATPSPTPPPYHDVLASFRAVEKNVADVGACEAIGKRAHVAIIALDGHVPQTYRAMGASGAQCWREVRATDTAYASALPARLFVPHHRVGTDVAFDLTGVPRKANSVDACTSAAHSVHVAALAYDDTWSGPYRAYHATRCYRPVSSDDSAADTAITYVVRVPAGELVAR